LKVFGEDKFDWIDNLILLSAESANVFCFLTSLGVLRGDDELIFLVELDFLEFDWAKLSFLVSEDAPLSRRNFWRKKY
jgi:hypothetical protein